MRTTITLDSDVEVLVREAMRERHAPLKTVVNEALRAALAGGGEHEPFSTPVYSMGEPAVSIDKALHIAADLEDDELLRKLEHRK